MASSSLSGKPDPHIHTHTAIFLDWHSELIPNYPNYPEKHTETHAWIHRQTHKYMNTHSNIHTQCWKPLSGRAEYWVDISVCVQKRINWYKLKCQQTFTMEPFMNHTVREGETEEDEGSGKYRKKVHITKN